MATLKPRPAFQSVELDPIDARLDARAAEKGIPTLVTPKIEEPPPEEEPAPVEPIAAVRRRPVRSVPNQATPRSRMISLKIELPDYVWIALRKRAAEDMVSLRYTIMSALRDKGIPINDVDMVTDGRRLR
jgi:hypothetical protein